VSAWPRRASLGARFATKRRGGRLFISRAYSEMQGTSLMLEGILKTTRKSCVGLADAMVGSVHFPSRNFRSCVSGPYSELDSSRHKRQSGGMADALDSKSCVLTDVWVRLPPLVLDDLLGRTFPSNWSCWAIKWNAFELRPSIRLGPNCVRRQSEKKNLSKHNLCRPSIS
jgi:hypothetical protein